MKRLEYADIRAKLVERMDPVAEIVLATCHNNKVTARTINCVCIDLQIYFLTSRAYTKCKQIEKNPQVALSVGEVQIEGIAQIKGHPLLEENQLCVEIFKTKQPDYFEKYARYKNTVLIEVSPTLFKSWKFDEGRHFSEIVDVQANEAYRKG